MDSIFPDKISAGLTFSALVSSSAYSAAAGWTVRAYLRGPSSIDIIGSPQGSQHRLSATAVQTASWLPGKYIYVIRATMDDDVEEIEHGQINILADAFSLPDGTDIRTVNQRTLDNINAVIEKRASQDQQRYVINNRELWRTPISDLLKLRALYADLVRQETNVARGRSTYGRSVRVRFTCPR